MQRYASTALNNTHIFKLTTIKNRESGRREGERSKNAYMVVFSVHLMIECPLVCFQKMQIEENWLHF